MMITLVFSMLVSACSISSLGGKHWWFWYSLSIKFFSWASAPLRVVAQVVVGVWPSSLATSKSISSRLCSK